MKAVLLMGAAVALLSVTASVASDAPQSNAQPAQVFDYNAQAQAFPSGSDQPNVARQCFNGRNIMGVNRSGAQTLYIQPAHGGIYQMRLTDDCAGLADAKRIALRAQGSDLVCPGERADLIAWAASTPQRCAVADVRRLSAKEVNALASAARR